MGAVDKAGQEVAAHAERSVRGEALEAGWPREEAAKITASHEDGFLHIDHGDAGDWEYGNEDRPPLAVGRQYLNHAEQHADVVFQNAVIRHLNGLI
jgi:hypothetical protein